MHEYICDISYRLLNYLCQVCISISIYIYKDTNPCQKRYTHINIRMTSPIDYSTFHIKWISSKTSSINSKASCIFPKEIYTYAYTHDISYRLLNYLYQVDIFKSQLYKLKSKLYIPQSQLFLYHIALQLIFRIFY